MQSPYNKMMKFVFFAALAVASYGASVPETEHSGIEGYIVGGRDTEISEVPHQVALYFNGKLSCGGSIISRTMIVTSARCVVGISANQITVRAGSSNPNGGGVLLKAKNLIPHNKYDSDKIDYDVAVVELEQPLTFSNTIKPIGLATVEPSDGTQVQISGYGLLSEDGKLATTLQSVLVPVVSRRTCVNNLWKYFKVTPRMICAGTEGKDACRGDGGGPLSSGGQLVGIGSFGIGCARKDLPGVYTNVANPEIYAFIRKTANI